MTTEALRTTPETKSETINRVQNEFFKRDLSVVPQDLIDTAVELEKFESELTKSGQPYAFKMHIETLTNTALDFAANVLKSHKEREDKIRQGQR